MTISKLMMMAGALMIAACLLAGAPVLAQGGTNGDAVEAAKEVVSTLIPDAGLKFVGLGLGLGLVVMGGGRGIGNIGSSAVESIARQPEAVKDISAAMLLSAAFVEGATLFGIVVLFVGIFTVA